MTASATIRDATPADIAAITAIYDHAVRHETASFELEPPDAAEMLRRHAAITAQGYPYLVAAEADGRVIGYAYAGPYKARPAYRWTVENSVYLAPDVRGRGIGKALTARIIARCEQLGFRRMIAIVGGSGHLASIRMHERLGFEHIGTAPGTGFKHGAWLDTVMLQRPLGEANETAPDAASYPGTLYRAP